MRVTPHFRARPPTLHSGQPPGPSRGWDPSVVVLTLQRHAVAVRFHFAPCALLHTSGCTLCILPQLAPHNHSSWHAPPACCNCRQAPPGAVCPIAHQLVDALLLLGYVCRIAHQPDAHIAPGHQCLRLFHASQVTDLTLGRTRTVDHGGT